MSMGGAQRVVANLCNYWSTSGADVTIITIDSISKDFYALEKNIKRISINQANVGHNLFQSIINNIKRMVFLRKVLNGEKPDVAISFMDSANVLLSLASLFLKNIICIGSERIHPANYPLPRVWKIMRYGLYGRLDAIVALTKQTADWIILNTRAKNIVIIPNPVFFPIPNKEPIRDIPSGLNSRRIILAVGRLAVQKRFALLINTFHKISCDFPLWSLVILGDGELQAELESQIKSLGLEDRVFLPGMAGNVAEWYERADLYVMTSEYEGFPNTLIEAMSYGCPAISFDCDTGPRDIIRHQVDGLLVENNNIQALELSMCRLMSDDYLRLQYSGKAVDVRERFSFSIITKMWWELFKECGL